MADIDGYDENTGTFYVAAELSVTDSSLPSSLVAYIPAAARMVSVDVALATGGGTYTVYVTNSSYDDAVAEGDSVMWYPTSAEHLTVSAFMTKSGCAGAYKVVMESGAATVKVRAK